MKKFCLYCFKNIPIDNFEYHLRTKHNIVKKARPEFYNFKSENWSLKEFGPKGGNQ